MGTKTILKILDTVAVVGTFLLGAVSVIVVLVLLQEAGMI